MISQEKNKTDFVYNFYCNFRKCIRTSSLSRHLISIVSTNLKLLLEIGTSSDVTHKKLRTFTFTNKEKIVQSLKNQRFHKYNLNDIVKFSAIDEQLVEFSEL